MPVEVIYEDEILSILRKLICDYTDQQLSLDNIVAFPLVFIKPLHISQNRNSQILKIDDLKTILRVFFSINVNPIFFVSAKVLMKYKDNRVSTCFLHLIKNLIQLQRITIPCFFFICSFWKYPSIVNNNRQ